MAHKGSHFVWFHNDNKMKCWKFVANCLSYGMQGKKSNIPWLNTDACCLTVFCDMMACLSRGSWDWYSAMIEILKHSGTCYTIVYELIIQILQKYSLNNISLTWIIMIWSGQNLAYIRTTELSWHVEISAWLGYENLSQTKRIIARFPLWFHKLFVRSTSEINIHESEIDLLTWHLEFQTSLQWNLIIFFNKMYVWINIKSKSASLAVKISSMNIDFDSWLGVNLRRKSRLNDIRMYLIIILTHHTPLGHHWFR